MNTEEDIILADFRIMNSEPRFSGALLLLIFLIARFR